MEKNAITQIKGIGKRRAEALATMGIYSIQDLLDLLPRAYRDMSTITRIRNIIDGQTVLIIGTVCSDVSEKRTKSIILYQFEVTDDPAYSQSGEFTPAFGETDRLMVTLFNQKFTAAKIKKGMKIILYGKTDVFGNYIDMRSPIIEETYEGGLKAIYPLKAGISPKIIQKALKMVLFGDDKYITNENSVEDIKINIIETLSDELRKKYNLCSKKEAYLKIHFPQNEDDVQMARNRLAFEELLIFQISLVMMKRRIKKQDAPSLDKPADMDFFRSLLPYTLTAAQENVIAEAVEDMKKPCPMSRIVQGDVGSGKTVVAAALCYYAKVNGGQSCLMVPTEILAIQHYNDLKELLEKCDMTVELLTGSTTPSEKKRIKTSLAAGEIDLIIGTHALTEDNVIFKNLCLAITDEQHRFGVKQRANLSAKGEDDLFPHVLVMSATPIPRTLALILYGDMDISIIDTLPAGRKKVSTFLLNSESNARMYEYVAEQVNLGLQAYVVCPLVEDGENEELKSVSAFAEELREKYMDCKPVIIEYLHGKMSGKEKDRILKSFSENKINVLVSTTVIEVGVNVPNATVMIIQNAERFGLSQLHQLRGRVGRSDKKSYCFLISDTKSESTLERLQAFCETNNGFEISKKDLEIRGPGDFFGKRQHGLPEFKIADIVNDMDMLLTTKNAATELMSDKDWHKKNENQELKHEVARFFIRTEREIAATNNI